MGFSEYLAKNKLEISEGTGTEKDETAKKKASVEGNEKLVPNGNKTKKNQKGRKKKD